MQSVQTLHFLDTLCEGPCFYKGVCRVSRMGDTFLAVKRARKGALWLNGRLLGRMWIVGPQRSLYAPASWLKTESSKVVVFDLFGAGGVEQVEGHEQPVFLEKQP